MVVIPEETRLDGRQMWDFVIRHSINVIDCTPTQWRILTEPGIPKGLPTPFCVLFGGEKISAPMWAELVAAQQRQPDRLFFNLYGPTEATVDTAISQVTSSSESNAGAPLLNIQAYVLNDYLQPVAENVVGEVYIGGMGVARGYLRQPSMTASKFIPDPFSQKPGARLYQSGDFARWNKEGSLEIVGRMDEQIKVRGVRVELAEIESVVRSLPEITEAAVVSREDNVGDQRLAAYFIPEKRNTRKAGTRSRFDLPNGMAVVHKNRHETDYVYDEIFVQQSYVQHGICLPRSGCVLDVGANIGLFSLFVSLYCPDTLILAFEPIPELFQLLTVNTEWYSNRIRRLPFGLSDRQRTEVFTYYSGYTVMSGQSSYADADSEAAVIRRFLKNQEQQGDATASGLMENMDEILEQKFQSEDIPVSLHRLSDILSEQGIDTVDLLKIDVQRAEWDVLRGIRDQDWPRIKQIVMEVHSTDSGIAEGMVEKVVNFLEARGYKVVADQHDLLKGTDRYNVYARREGYAGITRQQLRSHPAILDRAKVITEEDVRSFLRNKLPDYLIPNDYILMEEFPLNRSGKIDKHSLPPPGQHQQESKHFVAPAKGLQAMIADVWKEILHVEKVGIKDNFFDIGGHSLTLVQVHTALCKRLDQNISILDLFQHPSIESLTEFLGHPPSSSEQDQQEIEERADKARRRRQGIRNQEQSL